MPNHNKFSDIIYLVELQWHAELIVDAIDEAQALIDGFEELPEDERNGYQRVGPVNTKVHRALQAALTSGASIKRLLYPVPKQGSEGVRRAARGAHLASFLDGLDLPAIRDARIRNSLEHYDEFLDAYVDKLAAGSLDDTITVYNWVAADMPMNSRTGAEAVYPLRVFFEGTGAYRNGDREINIHALYAEARAILERLETVTFVGRTLEHWRVSGLPSSLMRHRLPLTEAEIRARKMSKAATENAAQAESSVTGNGHDNQGGQP